MPTSWPGRKIRRCSRSIGRLESPGHHGGGGGGGEVGGGEPGDGELFRLARYINQSKSSRSEASIEIKGGRFSTGGGLVTAYRHRCFSMCPSAKARCAAPS